jgi:hypothetical protein
MSIDSGMENGIGKIYLENRSRIRDHYGLLASHYLALPSKASIIGSIGARQDEEVPSSRRLRQHWQVASVPI